MGVLPTYFNFNIQISSRHLIGRKISNFEQSNGWNSLAPSDVTLTWLPHWLHFSTLLYVIFTIQHFLCDFHFPTFFMWFHFPTFLCDFTFQHFLCDFHFSTLFYVIFTFQHFYVIFSLQHFYVIFSFWLTDRAMWWDSVQDLSIDHPYQATWPEIRSSNGPLPTLPSEGDANT